LKHTRGFFAFIPRNSRKPLTAIRGAWRSSPRQSTAFHGVAKYGVCAKVKTECRIGNGAETGGQGGNFPHPLARFIFFGDFCIYGRRRLREASAQQPPTDAAHTKHEKKPSAETPDFQQQR